MYIYMILYFLAWSSDFLKRYCEQIVTDPKRHLPHVHRSISKVTHIILQVDTHPMFPCLDNHHMIASKGKWHSIKSFFLNNKIVVNCLLLNCLRYFKTRINIQNTSNDVAFQKQKWEQQHAPNLALVDFGWLCNWG